MKNCELCGQRARMFCESDQANLCWDCDEKVHCANFLVAKHARSLLCHVCQSPTPWTASGRKLTPTVSVCEGCVEIQSGKCERGGEQESRRDIRVDDVDDVEDGEGFESYDGDDSEEDDEEEDEDEEEEDEDEEDEDGENQVVPWAYASSSSPPPPPVSSSEEEISGGAGVAGVASKRRKDYGVDLDSDDEIECSSALPGSRPIINDEATSSSSHRPLKRARVTGSNQSANIQDDACRTGLKSTAVIRSIQRLQNRLPTDIDDASKMIFGICKMSRDQNR